MSSFAIPAKTLAAYDLNDINTIVTQQVVESSLIEFKREPPGGRWNSEQRLNDEGRDGLIKEIIAFANSFGGTLFVGIDETADHPKRASTFVPVPKVADLAERLERCLQSCVEPQLMSSEIVPIVTNNTSGEGALLVRVQPSPVAPHWNKTRGKCYRRIGADSMEIGMLDMQSLTLERAKTAEQFDLELAVRRQSALTDFSDQRAVRARGVLSWRPDIDFPAAFSIRCTAVPTMPIRMSDPISTRPDLRLGTIPIFVRAKGATGPSRALSWYGTNSPDSYRPALREWRLNVAAGSRDAIHSQLVRASGLIESRYVQCNQTETNNLRAPIVMPIEFIFTIVLSCLYHIELFRRRTGHDGLSYEMEFGIITEGVVQIAYLNGVEQPGPLRFEEKQICFPKYLISSIDTFQDIATAIQHDIYNAMGRFIDGTGIVQLELDEQTTALSL